MKSFLILALLLALGSVLLSGCASTTVPQDQPKTTTVPQDNK